MVIVPSPEPRPDPAVRQARGRRRITLLGATGSVGASAVDLIAAHPEDFAVEAVTANASAEALATLARRLDARLAVVGDAGAYAALSAALAGTGIEVAAGPAALAEAACRPVDLTVAAIVGAAGLEPTLAAVEAGNDVAIANKECLVCAGDLFVAAARRTGIRVLPVDSEHNAIFQALETRNRDEVDRIVLTASGGPFWQWTREAMAAATPVQALAHPNWSMGPKITIDSATLMNKGLEVIEAHYLFGMAPDRIDVLVHRQSIVHGLVAYGDGSVLAELGVPDMRTPLSHCLWWPERRSTATRRLDLAALGTLTFERVDPTRFPAVEIARAALAAGGWATNMLNAANEVAVDAFLKGAIGYLDIVPVAEKVLDRAGSLDLTRTVGDLAAAVALDAEGRRLARGMIAGRRSA